MGLEETAGPGLDFAILEEVLLQILKPNGKSGENPAQPRYCKEIPIPANKAKIAETGKR